MTSDNYDDPYEHKDYDGHDNEFQDNNSYSRSNNRKTVSKTTSTTGRKVIMLVVALCILAVAGAGLVWYGPMFMGPKDLGVRYNEADYLRALDKADLSINFKGQSGQTIDSYIETLPGKKATADDFRITATGFEEKKVVLSNSEMTALLNGMAPINLWFDKIQVKVDNNGQTEASAKVHLPGIIDDVYRNDPRKDEFKDLTKALPEYVNVYYSGQFDVSDAKVDMRADVATINGIDATVDTKGITPIDAVEDVFSKLLLTTIPEIKVNSIKTDESGNFAVDWYFPSNIEIEPKA